MVIQSFWGRPGGGVNKVLYGLCENSEFHSFLVLNMRTLLRLQTFYLFIGIKYKCLSQSCFSIFLICCELLSITVRLDDASNQSVAKPMKMKQTNVAQTVRFLNVLVMISRTFWNSSTFAFQIRTFQNVSLLISIIIPNVM